MRWTMILATTLALASGCSSNEDETDVTESAQWLCRWSQLEKPDPSFLLDDDVLAEHVRSEDLAFLEQERRARLAKSNPFSKLARGLDSAMTPMMQALVEARSRHVECDVVSVEIDGDRATATVRQTGPHFDISAASLTDSVTDAQELAAIDSHEGRVARAETWMKEAPRRSTEEYQLRFVKTPDGWRADYGLAP